MVILTYFNEEIGYNFDTYIMGLNMDIPSESKGTHFLQSMY